jgi:PAS domain S-box-containing protein
VRDVTFVEEVLTPMAAPVRIPVGRTMASDHLVSSIFQIGQSQEPSELRSDRIVIFAGEQPAAKIEAVLLEGGLSAVVCGSIQELIAEVESGADVAIIHDAALAAAERGRLAQLHHVPAWSGLQIVLLADDNAPGASDEPFNLPGHIILAAYPLRARSFLSVIGAATRARGLQREHRAISRNYAANKRLLGAALSAGQLGGWVLSLSDLSVQTSATFRLLFGHAPDRPMSLAEVEAAIHPADLSKWRTAGRQIRRTGKDVGFELRLIWPDGSEHWTQFDVRVGRDAGGAITSLAGVCMDITSRKATEAQNALVREQPIDHAAVAATVEALVAKQTERLMKEVAAREKVQDELRQVQKMETIGQLTGGVAHDFNNLLTAIMGNMELLRRRVPDEARLHRLIDSAIVGVQRGATLTQQLLAFSRQQDLRTEPVHLGQLVLGMREVLTRVLGPGTTLNMTIPDGLPPARIDAGQLEIAILNLALNARDAMLDGGTIDITVARHVAVGNQDLVPGEYLKVTVADTGTGMTSGVLDKAIEPFFSTKPLGKGNGLGLSMVHGLAVQLGGALELESSPHAGTTAVLVVPATDAAPEVAQPPPVMRNEPKNATILFVDDDPSILLSTTEMLEDLGHKVISANSGTQALAIINSDQPLDILMTDYAMPGMTGDELAVATRKSRPALPILLATGYVDLPRGVRMDLPRLQKPYHMDELRSRLAQMLV